MWSKMGKCRVCHVMIGSEHQFLELLVLGRGTLID